MLGLIAAGLAFTAVFYAFYLNFKDKHEALGYAAFYTVTVPALCLVMLNVFLRVPLNSIATYVVFALIAGMAYWNSKTGVLTQAIGKAF